MRHRPLPRIWLMFLTLYLRRSEAEARAWWSVVERARWSHATALRRTILIFEAQPAPSYDAVESFMTTVLTPQAVIGLLEALVDEGVCARTAATGLEESILAKVTAAGEWLRQ